MNRTYFKFTLVLLLGLLFSGNLFAQGEPQRKRRRMTPEQRAARFEKIMTRMKDSLNLSNEQVTKVKDLNIKMQKKMRAARKEYADDRQMMREEMMDLRIRYKKGMKKVLDKQQWKKFKRMEAERQKRRRERRKKRGNGGE